VIQDQKPRITAKRRRLHHDSVPGHSTLGYFERAFVERQRRPGAEFAPWAADLSYVVICLLFQLIAGCADVVSARPAGRLIKSCPRWWRCGSARGRRSCSIGRLPGSATNPALSTAAASSCQALPGMSSTCRLMSGARHAGITPTARALRSGVSGLMRAGAPHVRESGAPAFCSVQALMLRREGERWLQRVRRGVVRRQVGGPCSLV